MSGATSGTWAYAPGADDVAARYARPPRRGRRLLLVVLGVVLVLAAFASVAASVLERDVRWRDVSFAVLDEDTVRVTFEVYAEQGDLLRCQVRAADARYGDVGQLEVDLGPLPARGESRTVEVRTVAPAASASVRTCVRLP